MVGYDRHRFVDLSDAMAEELTCSECHMIYATAVDTNCRHTLCRTCLESHIDRIGKVCPICSKSLATSDVPDVAIVDDDVIVIGGDVVVTHNLMANKIIAKLDISCDNKPYGCPQVFKLSLMSTHLEICQFKTCATCGLSIGQSTDGHNCVDKLIEDRIELKHKLNQTVNKCQTLELEIKSAKDKAMASENRSRLYHKDLVHYKPKAIEFEAKCNELQNQLNRSLNESQDSQQSERKKPKLDNELDGPSTSQSIGTQTVIGIKEEDIKYQPMSVSAKPQCLYFGTFQTMGSIVELQYNYIRLANVVSKHMFNDKQVKYHIMIPFNEIQTIEYFTGTSCTVICIKPEDLSCARIQRSLRLGTTGLAMFDINSCDPNKQNIVILFGKALSDTFLTNLTQNVHFLGECRPMDPMAGQQLIANLLKK